MALAVRAPVAVLPCCQSTRLCDTAGLEAWLEPGLAIDVTRAHRLRAAGYRTIVVANADRSLAEQVAAKHREAGWQNRLCLAQGRATSGVLEGCRSFGLL